MAQSATVSNLVLRIVSAAVMAPLAVGAAYLGGWPFALFWAAAAIAVLWEWITLVAGPNKRLMLSSSGWIVAGIGYAGVLLLAPLLLRGDNWLGFVALVLLFAIVWTTDIFGYFAGRGIGGPKLLPRVSPKKTWSGAIAGALGAMIAAVLVTSALGDFDKAAIAGLALLLSVLSQGGDLLESFIKRRFGAKDASTLIPGHGGVMDRLDGFWAAALAACIIGLLRGGFDEPARGLLVW